MQPEAPSNCLSLCSLLRSQFFKAGSMPPARRKRSHQLVQGHVANELWSQELNSGPSDCRAPIRTPCISFRGCHGKIPEAGWLKQRKCFVSQPWRLDPRSGVGRLGPLAALRESASGPSPAPSDLLATSRAPGLVDTPAPSLPSSSHTCSLVRVSVPESPISIKTHVTLAEGHPDDLVLTNYICNSSISICCGYLFFMPNFIL